MTKTKPAPESGEDVLRARLAAIVDAAEDAIIAKTLDGTITHWNEGATRLFGYTAEEMVGQSVISLIPEDRHDEEMEILARVARGKRVRNFMTVRLTKSQQPVQVSVSVSPIHNAAGEVVEASTIIRDVSLLQEREVEYGRISRLYTCLRYVNQAVVFSRTREELFERVSDVLVEHGGFSMVWVGIAHEETKRILPVHATGKGTNYAYDIQVYTDERPEGMGPAGLAFRKGQPVVSSDALEDSSMRPWHETLQKYGFRSCAALPIHLMGEPLGVVTLYSADPLYFQDKELALLAEVASDVSFAIDTLAHKERHHAAEIAAEDERQFSSTMIESLPGILYFYDHELRFQRWNQRFEIVTGYTPEELLENHPLDYLREEDKPLVASRIAEVFEKGEASVEALLRAKDGTLTPYIFTGRRVMYKGKPALVGVGVDISERKKTEQQLLHSEGRYRALFENAPDGILIADTDGYYVDVNTSVCRMLGYTREELIGKHSSEIVVPSETKHIPAALLSIQKGQYQREWIMRRKDGSTFPADIIATTMPDGLLLGMVRDVTERKRSEALIRLNEGRYRTLFENAPDGILIVGDGSTYIDANASICQMLGYTREEFVGMQSTDIIAGEELPELDAVREIMRTTGRHQREWLLRRKDGSTFPADVIATMMPGGHLIGMVRDITERKRADNELHWKTAFLEALVDSAHDGILVVNAEGRRILQNQRMNDILQIPPDVDESADHNLQIRFIAPRTKKPQEFGEKVTYLYSHPDQVSRDEVEFLDGTVFDRYSAPVRDAAGVYYGRIWIFHDVTTERTRESALAGALEHEKELSEKARAGERAKGEFLAVMSHEIRTPLNGILGSAELLARSVLNEEARSYVRTISASGEALLTTLDDVLDFSRLEAGRMELEKTIFSPQELIDSVRLMLFPLATEKELLLTISVDAAVPRFVEGDAPHIRQILINLVGNALKFTKEGCVMIGVRPGREPEHVDFVVSDTGAGIAPEMLEKIFQPFTQADSSLARRHGGVGLGLAISHRLAVLMRGTLTVRSKVGEGTEFTLSLPLRETGNPSPRLANAADLPLDESFAKSYPLRLLVVEDDKVNLRLIISLLRRLGYEPHSATNGLEAVESNRRVRPECILMDVQMPELDGIDATCLIRSHEGKKSPSARAYIIALTANILPADRQRCFEAGMDAYLSKPVKLAAIAGALHAAYRDLHAPDSP